MQYTLLIYPINMPSVHTLDLPSQCTFFHHNPLSSPLLIQVCNDHTLQLNVSGAMIRSFSHVYNLITTIIEELQAQGQGPGLGPGLGPGQGPAPGPAPGQGLGPAPGLAPGPGSASGQGLALGLTSSDNTSSIHPLPATTIKPPPSTTLRPTTPPPTTTSTTNTTTTTTTSYGATLTDKSLASGSDSPVTFRNCLEFPLEIFDALTREPLVFLRPGETVPLQYAALQSRSWVQSQGKYPSLFDVKVLGKLRDERLPLLQVPHLNTLMSTITTHPLI